jgi:hypothetical protein
MAKLYKKATIDKIINYYEPYFFNISHVIRRAAREVFVYSSSSATDTSVNEEILTKANNVVQYIDYNSFTKQFEVKKNFHIKNLLVSINEYLDLYSVTSDESQPDQKEIVRTIPIIELELEEIFDGNNHIIDFTLLNSDAQVGYPSQIDEDYQVDINSNTFASVDTSRNEIEYNYKNIRNFFTKNQISYHTTNGFIQLQINEEDEGAFQIKNVQLKNIDIAPSVEYGNINYTDATNDALSPNDLRYYFYYNGGLLLGAYSENFIIKNCNIYHTSQYLNEMKNITDNLQEFGLTVYEISRMNEKFGYGLVQNKYGGYGGVVGSFSCINSKCKILNTRVKCGMYGNMEGGGIVGASCCKNDSKLEILNCNVSIYGNTNYLEVVLYMMTNKSVSGDINRLDSDFLNNDELSVINENIDEFIYRYNTEFICYKNIINTEYNFGGILGASCGFNNSEIDIRVCTASLYFDSCFRDTDKNIITDENILRSYYPSVVFSDLNDQYRFGRNYYEKIDELADTKLKTELVKKRQLKSYEEVNIGGVVGSYSVQDSALLKISGCQVYGNIIVENTINNSGGIIGAYCGIGKIQSFDQYANLKSIPPRIIIVYSKSFLASFSYHYVNLLEKIEGGITESLSYLDGKHPETFRAARDYQRDLLDNWSQLNADGDNFFEQTWNAGKSFFKAAKESAEDTIELTLGDGSIGTVQSTADPNLKTSLRMMLANYVTGFKNDSDARDFLSHLINNVDKLLYNSDLNVAEPSKLPPFHSLLRHSFFFSSANFSGGLIGAHCCRNGGYFELSNCGFYGRLHTSCGYDYVGGICGSYFCNDFSRAFLDNITVAETAKFDFGSDATHPHVYAPPSAGGVVGNFSVNNTSKLYMSNIFVNSTSERLLSGRNQILQKNLVELKNMDARRDLNNIVRDRIFEIADINVSSMAVESLLSSGKENISLFDMGSLQRQQYVTYGDEKKQNGSSFTAPEINYRYNMSENTANAGSTSSRSLLNILGSNNINNDTNIEPEFVKIFDITQSRNLISRNVTTTNQPVPRSMYIDLTHTTDLSYLLNVETTSSLFDSTQGDYVNIIQQANGEIVIRYSNSLDADIIPQKTNFDRIDTERINDLDEYLNNISNENNNYIDNVELIQYNYEHIPGLDYVTNTQKSGMKSSSQRFLEYTVANKSDIESSLSAQNNFNKIVNEYTLTVINEIGYSLNYISYYVLLYQQTINIIDELNISNNNKTLLTDEQIQAIILNDTVFESEPTEEEMIELIEQYKITHYGITLTNDEIQLLNNNRDTINTIAVSKIEDTDLLTEELDVLIADISLSDSIIINKNQSALEMLSYLKGVLQDKYSNFMNLNRDDQERITLLIIKIIRLLKTMSGLISVKTTPLTNLQDIKNRLKTALINSIDTIINEEFINDYESLTKIFSEYRGNSATIPQEIQNIFTLIDNGYEGLSDTDKISGIRNLNNTLNTLLQQHETNVTFVNNELQRLMAEGMSYADAQDYILAEQAKGLYIPNSNPLTLNPYYFKIKNNELLDALGELQRKTSTMLESIRNTDSFLETLNVTTTTIINPINKTAMYKIISQINVTNLETNLLKQSVLVSSTGNRYSYQDLLDAKEAVASNSDLSLKDVLFLNEPDIEKNKLINHFNLLEKKISKYETDFLNFKEDLVSTTYIDSTLVESIETYMNDPTKQQDIRSSNPLFKDVFDYADSSQESYAELTNIDREITFTSTSDINAINLRDYLSSKLQAELDVDTKLDVYMNMVGNNETELTSETILDNFSKIQTEISEGIINQEELRNRLLAGHATDLEYSAEIVNLEDANQDIAQLSNQTVTLQYNEEGPSITVTLESYRDAKIYNTGAVDPDSAIITELFGDKPDDVDITIYNEQTQSKIAELETLLPTLEERITYREGVELKLVELNKQNPIDLFGDRYLKYIDTYVDNLNNLELKGRVISIPELSKSITYLDFEEINTRLINGEISEAELKQQLFGDIPDGITQVDYDNIVSSNLQELNDLYTKVNGSTEIMNGLKFSLTTDIIESQTLERIEEIANKYDEIVILKQQTLDDATSGQSYSYHQYEAALAEVEASNGTKTIDEVLFAGNNTITDVNKQDILSGFNIINNTIDEKLLEIKGIADLEPSLKPDMLEYILLSMENRRTINELNSITLTGVGTYTLEDYRTAYNAAISKQSNITFEDLFGLSSESEDYIDHVKTKMQEFEAEFIKNNSEIANLNSYISSQDTITDRLAKFIDEYARAKQTLVESNLLLEKRLDLQNLFHELILPDTLQQSLSPSQKLLLQTKLSEKLSGLESVIEESQNKLDNLQNLIGDDIVTPELLSKIKEYINVSTSSEAGSSQLRRTLKSEIKELEPNIDLDLFNKIDTIESSYKDLTNRLTSNVIVGRSVTFQEIDVINTIAIEVLSDDVTKYMGVVGESTEQLDGIRSTLSDLNTKIASNVTELSNFVNSTTDYTTDRLVKYLSEYYEESIAIDEIRNHVFKTENNRIFTLREYKSAVEAFEQDSSISIEERVFGSNSDVPILERQQLLLEMNSLISETEVRNIELENMRTKYTGDVLNIELFDVLDQYYGTLTELNKLKDITTYTSTITGKTYTYYDYLKLITGSISNDELYGDDINNADIKDKLSTLYSDVRALEIDLEQMQSEESSIFTDRVRDFGTELETRTQVYQSKGRTGIVIQGLDKQYTVYEYKQIQKISNTESIDIRALIYKDEYSEILSTDPINTTRLNAMTQELEAFETNIQIMEQEQEIMKESTTNAYVNVLDVDYIDEILTNNQKIELIREINGYEYTLPNGEKISLNKYYYGKNTLDVNSDTFKTMLFGENVIDESLINEIYQTFESKIAERNILDQELLDFIEIFYDEDPIKRILQVNYDQIKNEQLLESMYISPETGKVYTMGEFIDASDRMSDVNNRYTSSDTFLSDFTQKRYGISTSDATATNTIYNNASTIIDEKVTSIEQIHNDLQKGILSDADLDAYTEYKELASRKQEFEASSFTTSSGVEYKYSTVRDIGLSNPTITDDELINKLLNGGEISDIDRTNLLEFITNTDGELSTINSRMSSIKYKVDDVVNTLLSLEDYKIANNELTNRIFISPTTGNELTLQQYLDSKEELTQPIDIDTEIKTELFGSESDDIADSFIEQFKAKEQTILDLQTRKSLQYTKVKPNVLSDIDIEKLSDYKRNAVEIDALYRTTIDDVNNGKTKQLSFFEYSYAKTLSENTPGLEIKDVLRGVDGRELSDEILQQFNTINENIQSLRDEIQDIYDGADVLYDDYPSDTLKELFSYIEGDYNVKLLQESVAISPETGETYKFGTFDEASKIQITDVDVRTQEILFDETVDVDTRNAALSAADNEQTLRLSTIESLEVTGSQKLGIAGDFLDNITKYNENVNKLDFMSSKYYGVLHGKLIQYNVYAEAKVRVFSDPTLNIFDELGLDDDYAGNRTVELLESVDAEYKALEIETNLLKEEIKTGVFTNMEIDIYRTAIEEEISSIYNSTLSTFEDPIDGVIYDPDGLPFKDYVNFKEQQLLDPTITISDTLGLDPEINKNAIARFEAEYVKYTGLNDKLSTVIDDATGFKTSADLFGNSESINKLLDLQTILTSETYELEFVREKASRLQDAFSETYAYAQHFKVATSSVQRETAFNNYTNLLATDGERITELKQVTTDLDARIQTLQTKLEGIASVDVDEEDIVSLNAKNNMSHQIQQRLAILNDFKEKYNSALTDFTTVTDEYRDMLPSEYLTNPQLSNEQFTQKFNEFEKIFQYTDVDDINPVDILNPNGTASTNTQIYTRNSTLDSTSNINKLGSSEVINARTRTTNLFIEYDTKFKDAEFIRNNIFSTNLETEYQTFIEQTDADPVLKRKQTFLRGYHNTNEIIDLRLSAMGEMGSIPNNKNILPQFAYSDITNLSDIYPHWSELVDILDDETIDGMSSKGTGLFDKYSLNIDKVSPDSIIKQNVKTDLDTRVDTLLSGNSEIKISQLQDLQRETITEYKTQITNSYSTNIANTIDNMKTVKTDYTTKVQTLLSKFDYLDLDTLSADMLTKATKLKTSFHFDVTAALDEWNSELNRGFLDDIPLENRALVKDILDTTQKQFNVTEMQNILDELSKKADEIDIGFGVVDYKEVMQRHIQTFKDNYIVKMNNILDIVKYTDYTSKDPISEVMDLINQSLGKSENLYTTISDINLETISNAEIRLKTIEVADEILKDRSTYDNFIKQHSAYNHKISYPLYIENTDPTSKKLHVFSLFDLYPQPKVYTDTQAYAQLIDSYSSKPTNYINNAKLKINNFYLNMKFRLNTFLGKYFDDTERILDATTSNKYDSVLEALKKYQKSDYDKVIQSLNDKTSTPSTNLVNSRSIVPVLTETPPVPLKTFTVYDILREFSNQRIILDANVLDDILTNQSLQRRFNGNMFMSYQQRVALKHFYSSTMNWCYVNFKNVNVEMRKIRQNIIDSFSLDEINELQGVNADTNKISDIIRKSSNAIDNMPIGATKNILRVVRSAVSAIKSTVKLAVNAALELVKFGPLDILLEFILPAVLHFVVEEGIMKHLIVPILTARQERNLYEKMTRTLESTTPVTCHEYVGGSFKAIQRSRTPIYYESDKAPPETPWHPLTLAAMTATPEGFSEFIYNISPFGLVDGIASIAELAGDDSKALDNLQKGLIAIKKFMGFYKPAETEILEYPLWNRVVTNKSEMTSGLEDSTIVLNSEKSNATYYSITQDLLNNNYFTQYLNIESYDTVTLTSNGIINLVDSKHPISVNTPYVPTYVLPNDAPSSASYLTSPFILFNDTEWYFFVNYYTELYLSSTRNKTINCSTQPIVFQKNTEILLESSNMITNASDYTLTIRNVDFKDGTIVLKETDNITFENCKITTIINSGTVELNNVTIDNGLENYGTVKLHTNCNINEIKNFESITFIKNYSNTGSINFITNSLNSTIVIDSTSNSTMLDSIDGNPVMLIKQVVNSGNIDLMGLLIQYTVVSQEDDSSGNLFGIINTLYDNKNSITKMPYNTIIQTYSLNDANSSTLIFDINDESDSGLIPIIIQSINVDMSGIKQITSNISTLQIPEYLSDNQPLLTLTTPENEDEITINIGDEMNSNEINKIILNKIFNETNPLCFKNNYSLDSGGNVIKELIPITYDDKTYENTTIFKNAKINNERNVITLDDNSIVLLEIVSSDDFEYNYNTKTYESLPGNDKQNIDTMINNTKTIHLNNKVQLASRWPNLLDIDMSNKYIAEIYEGKTIYDEPDINYIYHEFFANNKVNDYFKLEEYSLSQPYTKRENELIRNNLLTYKNFNGPLVTSPVSILHDYLDKSVKIYLNEGEILNDLELNSMGMNKDKLQYILNLDPTIDNDMNKIRYDTTIKSISFQLLPVITDHFNTNYKTTHDNEVKTEAIILSMEENNFYVGSERFNTNIINETISYTITTTDYNIQYFDSAYVLKDDICFNVVTLNNLLSSDYNKEISQIARKHIVGYIREEFNLLYTVTSTVSTSLNTNDIDYERINPKDYAINKVYSTTHYTYRMLSLSDLFISLYNFKCPLITTVIIPYYNFKEYLLEDAESQITVQELKDGLDRVYNDSSFNSYNYHWKNDIDVTILDSFKSFKEIFDLGASIIVADRLFDNNNLIRGAYVILPDGTQIYTDEIGVDDTSIPPNTLPVPTHDGVQLSLNSYPSKYLLINLNGLGCFILDRIILDVTYSNSAHLDRRIYDKDLTLWGYNDGQKYYRDYNKNNMVYTIDNYSLINHCIFIPNENISFSTNIKYYNTDTGIIYDGDTEQGLIRVHIEEYFSHSLVFTEIENRNNCYKLLAVLDNLNSSYNNNMFTSTVTCFVPKYENLSTFPELNESNEIYESSGISRFNSSSLILPDNNSYFKRKIVAYKTIDTPHHLMNQDNITGVYINDKRSVLLYCLDEVKFNNINNSKYSLNTPIGLKPYIENRVLIHDFKTPEIIATFSRNPRQIRSEIYVRALQIDNLDTTLDKVIDTSLQNIDRPFIEPTIRKSGIVKLSLVSSPFDTMIIINPSTFIKDEIYKNGILYYENYKNFENNNIITESSSLANNFEGCILVTKLETVIDKNTPSITKNCSLIQDFFHENSQYSSINSSSYNIPNIHTSNNSIRTKNTNVVTFVRPNKLDLIDSDLSSLNIINDASTNNLVSFKYKGESDIDTDIEIQNYYSETSIKIISERAYNNMISRTKNVIKKHFEFPENFTMDETLNDYTVLYSIKGSEFTNNQLVFNNNSISHPLMDTFRQENLTNNNVANLEGFIFYLRISHTEDINKYHPFIFENGNVRLIIPCIKMIFCNIDKSKITGRGPDETISSVYKVQSFNPYLSTNYFIRTNTDTKLQYNVITDYPTRYYLDTYYIPQSTTIPSEYIENINDELLTQIIGLDYDENKVVLSWCLPYDVPDDNIYELKQADIGSSGFDNQKQILIIKKLTAYKIRDDTPVYLTPYFVEIGKDNEEIYDSEKVRIIDYDDYFIIYLNDSVLYNSETLNGYIKFELMDIDIHDQIIEEIKYKITASIIKKPIITNPETEYISINYAGKYDLQSILPQTQNNESIRYVLVNENITKYSFINTTTDENKSVSYNFDSTIPRIIGNNDIILVNGINMNNYSFGMKLYDGVSYSIETKLYDVSVSISEEYYNLVPTFSNINKGYTITEPEGVLTYATLTKYTYIYEFTISNLSEFNTVTIKLENVQQLMDSFGFFNYELTDQYGNLTKNINSDTSDIIISYTYTPQSLEEDKLLRFEIEILENDLTKIIGEKDLFNPTLSFSIESSLNQNVFTQNLELDNQTVYGTKPDINEIAYRDFYVGEFRSFLLNYNGYILANENTNDYDAYDYLTFLQEKNDEYGIKYELQYDYATMLNKMRIYDGSFDQLFPDTDIDFGTYIDIIKLNNDVLDELTEIFKFKIKNAYNESDYYSVKYYERPPSIVLNRENIYIKETLSSDVHVRQTLLQVNRDLDIIVYFSQIANIVFSIDDKYNDVFSIETDISGVPNTAYIRQKRNIIISDLYKFGYRVIGDIPRIIIPLNVTVVDTVSLSSSKTIYITYDLSRKFINHELSETLTSVYDYIFTGFGGLLKDSLIDGDFGELFNDYGITQTQYETFNQYLQIFINNLRNDEAIDINLLQNTEIDSNVKTILSEINTSTSYVYRIPLKIYYLRGALYSILRIRNSTSSFYIDSTYKTSDLSIPTYEDKNMIFTNVNDGQVESLNSLNIQTNNIGILNTVNESSGFEYSFSYNDVSRVVLLDDITNKYNIYELENNTPVNPIIDYTSAVKGWSNEDVVFIDDLHIQFEPSVMFSKIDLSSNIIFIDIENIGTNNSIVYKNDLVDIYLIENDPKKYSVTYKDYTNTILTEEYLQGDVLYYKDLIIVFGNKNDLVEITVIDDIPIEPGDDCTDCACDFTTSPTSYKGGVLCIDIRKKTVTESLYMKVTPIGNRSVSSFNNYSNRVLSITRKTIK